MNNNNSKQIYYNKPFKERIKSFEVLISIILLIIIVPIFQMLGGGMWWAIGVWTAFVLAVIISDIRLFRNGVQRGICEVHHPEYPIKILPTKLRFIRLLVGIISTICGLLLINSFAVVFAVLLLWFGLAHIIASITGYPGCPEIGALPSLILRRPISTGCGLWCKPDLWLSK